MSRPSTLLGLYRPGTTVLHRLPTGAKLLGLVLAGALVVLTRGPVAAVVATLVAVALAAVARTGWRRTARSLRPVLFLAVPIGLVQAWRLGWATGLEAALDLVSLVLAATVVTATSSLDSVVDALTTALRPLGARPERVAFAVALTVRSVPQVVDVVIESRDAARARGLERDPRAVLVPTVVRTVARARATGEALAARGLPDG